MLGCTQALSSEGDEQEQKEERAYKEADGAARDETFESLEEAVTRMPAKRTVTSLEKLTTQGSVRYLEVPVGLGADGGGRGSGGGSAGAWSGAGAGSRLAL